MLAVTAPPASAARELLSSLPREALPLWFSEPAGDGLSPAAYAARSGNAALNDHALLCLAVSGEGAEGLGSLSPLSSSSSGAAGSGSVAGARAPLGEAEPGSEAGWPGPLGGSCVPTALAAAAAASPLRGDWGSWGVGGRGRTTGSSGCDGAGVLSGGSWASVAPSRDGGLGSAAPLRPFAALSPPMPFARGMPGEASRSLAILPACLQLQAGPRPAEGGVVRRLGTVASAPAGTYQPVASHSSAGDAEALAALEALAAEDAAGLRGGSERWGPPE